MHFAGGSKCRWSVHKEGDPYANQAAFCQQLEMQMEAANAADVAQAFRVCAFRSVPVPFPFRSSFCVINWANVEGHRMEVVGLWGSVAQLRGRRCRSSASWRPCKFHHGQNAAKGSGRRDYCGWWRTPAPADGWFIHVYPSIYRGSTILLVVRDFFHPLYHWLSRP